MKIEPEEFDESVVTLDTYNSDLNLVIDASRYSARPLINEGFAFMWAGARATHGAAKGKFCFEVKLLQHLDVSHLPADEPSPHVVRVGFSVESSSLQLGEDPLSYGYGGTGKISTNCQFKDYGVSFIEGDCVCAAVNMDSEQVQIGFAKNGKFLGWAYKINKSELKGKALFAHVLTKNTSFEVNLGQKEKPYFALPDDLKDYLFIGCLPLEQRECGTRPPKRREDCEMIMMCGLPGAGKSVWAAEYAAKHPEKKYNVLGTNNIIDKMKVMGLPRKRNYRGRWEVLIQMSTKCLNKMFEIGSKLKRNYILDQTNVYPTAQRRKMRNFEGFKRTAVVVVPTEEEYKRRCDKRDRQEGKEVPDSAVLEMKANFKLPEVSDVFNDVIYTELGKAEAEKLVKLYNEEGRSAVGPPKKQFRPNEQSGFGSNRSSDAGRENFSPNSNAQSGRGRDSASRGGYDGGRGTSVGHGGYDGGRSGSTGRGGYDGSRSGNSGRGGYDGGRGANAGRGGYEGGRSSNTGRGEYEGGRGGGGGRQGVYEGGRGDNAGRAGYDNEFGGNRGGYRGSRGGFGGNRGGYEGNTAYESGSGGYSSGLGNFGNSRGGSDSNRGRASGYDDNRGGYDSNRGGFGSNRGGYGGNRGGYGNNRGGYDGNRGSYDSNRSGYDSSRSGYDDNRSGYGAKRNYDEGPGNDSGSFGRTSGGYGGGSGGYGSSGNSGGYGSSGNSQANFSSNSGGYNRGSANNAGGDFRDSRGLGSPSKFGSRDFNFGNENNSGGQFSDNSFMKEPALGAYDKGGSSDSRSSRGFRGGASHETPRGGNFRGSIGSRGNANSRGYGNAGSYGGYGGNDEARDVSSGYSSGYSGYQSDYNEKTQTGFRGGSDSYPREGLYGSVPQGGIKKEPGIHGSGDRRFDSGRSESGTGRSRGRTSTRWGAETTQTSSERGAASTQNTSSYSSFRAPVKTEPTGNTASTGYESYSGFRAAVKTEPADNAASTRYDTYSAQGSNYSSYGQGSQSKDFQQPPSYNYQSGAVASTASQPWAGAQVGSGTTEQPQWSQFYPPQSQPSQFYNQYYPQQAAGTAPAYGSYGAK